MKVQNTIPANAGSAPPAAQKVVPAAAVGGASPYADKHQKSAADSALTFLINFFTSLKLTVVCLVLGIILVFWGTLAQVDLGLYKAQNEFFRSFLIIGAKFLNWTIPVFPGGYLVGGVLVINLVASHFKRFTFTKDKAGLWMVHFGLILLLLGQFGTDMLSRESTLHLRDGESKNYSEADRQIELAVIDTTEPDLDKVVAIPEGVLMSRNEIHHSELPFVIKVNKFYGNSVVQNRPADATTPPPATQGQGTRAVVRGLPHVTEMDRRDVPSAIVEIMTPQGSLGSWLVSEYVDGPQSFTFDNRSYQLVMRLRRYYNPYTIQLKEFRHDLYLGTQIPKNFSSRIVLQRPDTGENREVLIKMNTPLRYAGQTFYQQGFDPDDKGTILQVVHNPSWLTPYFSCVLVGLGLMVHFAMHLLGLTFKRRTA